MSLNSRSDVSLQHLEQNDIYWREDSGEQREEMVGSDLQSGEEGQQRIHPGPSRKQRFVDVDVQQQRRLADVLHDGRIVLKAKMENVGLKRIISE